MRSAYRAPGTNSCPRTHPLRFRQCAMPIRSITAAAVGNVRTIFLIIFLLQVRRPVLTVLNQKAHSRRANSSLNVCKRDARSQSNMTGELLRWPRPRRREMLDGDAHQFRQGASAELGFELSAGIGYGLVAHMQVLGDNAVRFAFGQ